MQKLYTFIVPLGMCGDSRLLSQRRFQPFKKNF